MSEISRVAIIKIQHYNMYKMYAFQNMVLTTGYQAHTNFDELTLPVSTTEQRTIAIIYCKFVWLVVSS